MDGIGSIIAVVFVALILLGGGIAFQYAQSSAAPDKYSNETFDAGSLDTTESFNNSNINGATYLESPTVQDNQSQPYDTSAYTWHTDNGTLTIDSQALANTTNNTIQYSYSMPTQNQQQVTDYLGSVLTIGAWIPFILILGLILLVVGIFGGVS